MNKFDPTKPCTTRDGRAVRIIATDKKGGDTIIALVADAPDSELLMTYQSNGHYWCYEDLSPFDLVNIPEKRKVWVCFTKTGEAFYYDSKEEAQERIGLLQILAIKEVEFTTGEGL